MTRNQHASRGRSNLGNPMDECPSDEPITQAVLQCDWHVKDQVWIVYCPQGRCSVRNKSLAKAAAEILADIDSHNGEEGP